MGEVRGCVKSCHIVEAWACREFDLQGTQLCIRLDEQIDFSLVAGAQIIRMERAVCIVQAAGICSMTNPSQSAPLPVWWNNVSRSRTFDKAG